MTTRNKPRKVNLKLVDIEQEVAKRRQEDELDQTKKPAKWRAHKICTDIETLAVGLQFGLPHLADPEVEDTDVIPHWPVVLSNPSIEDCLDRLRDRLQEDGRNDLQELYGSVLEAAFVVGVLAGRIFRGATEQEIAQMEAGLVRAITAREQ